MTTKEPVISKDTKISITLVTALVAAVLTGSFWVKDTMQSTNTTMFTNNAALLVEVAKTNSQLLLVNSRLQGIERSVDTKYEYLEGYIDSRFQLMNDKLLEAQKDRIYRHEFLSWLNLLEASNEGFIEVPKID